MTDFLALISDNQAEGHFHGVLICKRIVPNRLHWFVLEHHDLTLARGSVECDRHTLDAQACVNLVVESVARKIDIDVAQIQVMPDSVVPVAPQNDYVASMIEIAPGSATTERGFHPIADSTKVFARVPAGS